VDTDHLSARRLGDRLLLDVVDAAFTESARRAGQWCACRVGCTECCRGPFPINALDAWRLREGLESLRAADPSRAEAVRSRAAHAVKTMTAGFPGDAARGELADDKRAEDAFCERFATLPCPALDPVSGACDLYAWRPMSCRTFGPPVRFGEQQLPPCRLWFDHAPASTVEQACVEPDPEDRERDLLEMVTADIDPGDTFVAFALVTP
jgi:Fe-S-cluster containining protein